MINLSSLTETRGNSITYMVMPELKKESAYKDVREWVTPERWEELMEAIRGEIISDRCIDAIRIAGPLKVLFPERVIDLPNKMHFDLAVNSLEGVLRNPQNYQTDLPEVLDFFSAARGLFPAEVNETLNNFPLLLFYTQKYVIERHSSGDVAGACRLATKISLAEGAITNEVLLGGSQNPFVALTESDIAEQGWDNLSQTLLERMWTIKLYSEDYVDQIRPPAEVWPMIMKDIDRTFWNKPIYVELLLSVAVMMADEVVVSPQGILVSKASKNISSKQQSVPNLPPRKQLP